jgi:hypothetical protein
MPSDEFLAANRRNWDERVPIHRRDRTGFYGKHAVSTAGWAIPGV